MEKSLSSNSLEESLNIYSQLAHLTELVHDTSTEHLRAYSANLTIHWYEQIKAVLQTYVCSLALISQFLSLSFRLNSRMEKILDLIEFPYVNKKPANSLAELFNNNREKFKDELVLLLKLRLPNHVKHEDTQSRLRFIGWKPIPLFIQILLKSLILRFNYHFYGKQKTNDRRKVIERIFLFEEFLHSFDSSRNGISIKLFSGFLIIMFSLLNNYNHY